MNIPSFIACPFCHGSILMNSELKNVDCLNCGRIFELEEGFIKYHFINENSFEFRNLKGYSKVAAEFSDSKRQTSANFHQLTKPLFLNAINLLQANDLVLDLGCGGGFITELMISRICSSNIVAADLSSAMLNETKTVDPNINLICCSAFNLPFNNECFAGILSSLGDPFCQQRMFDEIYRVLNTTGFFSLSAPSKNWVAGSRMDPNVSRYTLDDGTVIEVNSYLFDKSEIIEMAKKSKFTIELSETKYGRDLLMMSSNISHSILALSDRLGINLEDLPLIDFYLFRK